MTFPLSPGLIFLAGRVISLGNMELGPLILELGKRARAASKDLAKATTPSKNGALRAIADAIDARADRLLEANAIDVGRAQTNGLSPAMIDRLTLTPKRVAEMSGGVRSVAVLPDPVGEIIRGWQLPNGLAISKVRVPIGVIGIIYESRPNVTGDAAVLCLKTGNATILRGGSEAIESNRAIAGALREGLSAAGLPQDAIQLVPVTDREAVKLLCGMDRHLDVIVPRGGKGLIETVVSHARMPVIKHYDGICILYVDRAADLDMATAIALNAKCQRPGVCNAIETVLVHRDIAPAFFDRAGKALVGCGVQIRGDAATLDALASLAKSFPDKIAPASEADYRTEFLDLVLAAKVVESADEAVAHIGEHGSHHSDAIITSDPAVAEQFLSEVDSATVYWNASTRFTDGGQFGFGAEIGISTDKLHARGPMALEELTTYKYQIRGSGQIRE
jgi:glutamate-5-semialdehyde dehydrogenase